VSWDLGWHVFECLLAPLRAAGQTASVEISLVRTASYLPPPHEPSPPCATAARITGWLRLAGFSLPFDLRMGKGIGIDRKQIAYHRVAQPDLVVDLPETGRAAHHRLLEELLTAAEPRLGLDLAEAIDIVRLCVRAEQAAEVEHSYPFGELPAFLLDLPEAALLGLFY
jgi:hypothetical protein